MTGEMEMANSGVKRPKFWLQSCTACSQTPPPSSPQDSTSESDTQQSRLDQTIRWFSSRLDTLIVLNIVRILSFFVFGYCITNIVMVQTGVITNESVSIAYRYGMAIPTSVCIAINSVFIFVLASTQYRCCVRIHQINESRD